MVEGIQMNHLKPEIMEKKPKTHEELFEMYDQVSILEEKTKEMIGSIDMMIIRLKGLLYVIDLAKECAPKGTTDKIDLIGMAYKDIQRYELIKYNWDKFVKDKGVREIEYGVSVVIELRAHPEQLMCIPSKVFSTMEIILEDYIKILSGILTFCGKRLEDDGKKMDIIDESILQSVQKGKDWPTLNAMMENGPS